MEGVRDGAAEEDWRWDLNPGTAAMKGWDHVSLVRVRTTKLWGIPFATWFRKQERSYWEEKG